MFTELMPLLAERTVLITVARERDTALRATVIPKRAREGENTALSTPLLFVGTPEELDQNFGRALAALKSRDLIREEERLGQTRLRLEDPFFGTWLALLGHTYVVTAPASMSVTYSTVVPGSRKA